jgi:predicted nucleotidyltransferase
MAAQERLEETVFRKKRRQILELAKQFGAVNIQLFGSIVHGEAHECSDIDLLVEFEAGRTLIDHIGLVLALEQLLGRSVDIATPGTLHAYIRERVFAESVPL